MNLQCYASTVAERAAGGRASFYLNPWFPTWGQFDSLWEGADRGCISRMRKNFLHFFERKFNFRIFFFPIWMSCSLEACLDLDVNVNLLVAFSTSEIHFLNNKNYVSQRWSIRILEMLRWGMDEKRLGTTGLNTPIKLYKFMSARAYSLVKTWLLRNSQNNLRVTCWLRGLNRNLVVFKLLIIRGITYIEIFAQWRMLQQNCHFKTYELFDESVSACVSVPFLDIYVRKKFIYIYEQHFHLK